MKVYWLHLKEHTNPYNEGYIGISSQVHTRLLAHKRGTTSWKIREVIEQYGWENLITTILFEGSIEKCIEKEIHFRPKHRLGWNIFKGGVIAPNSTGRVLSQETKEKIRKANLGKIGTPNKWKGKTGRYTEEQRKLIGSYHKGKVISEAHKQAIREKLSRSNSPVASHVNVFHTDNPNEIIETFYCLQDYCDKYNIGYSAARSQLRNITQKGKALFLKGSRFPKYFITYIGQE